MFGAQSPVVTRVFSVELGNENGLDHLSRSIFVLRGLHPANLVASAEIFSASQLCRALITPRGFRGSTKGGKWLVLGVGAMGFWMPATTGTPYDMPGDPDQIIQFEFRAGKMTRSGTLVVPDRRKGLIRLVQSSDTLMHFQWWNRTGPTLIMEDDIIFLPEEATFEKVGQSSGRVFVLNFKYDERKFFYWMQEVDEAGDNAIAVYVQRHLNCPIVMDPEVEDSLVPIEVTPDGVLYQRSHLVPEGVVPLLEEPRALSTGIFQPADLQRILSGLSHPPEADLAMARDTGPGFSELLKPDVVAPLLENLHLEERLAPYLPEGVRTKQAIADLMQSPQFHQQLDSFTQVIRSGQIDLSQFGIDSSRYNFTVVSFLEAIEDQAISSAMEPETEQRSNQDVMEEGR